MPGIISTPKLVNDIDRANDCVFRTINTEEAKLRAQQPTLHPIYKDIQKPVSFRMLFLKRLEVQHVIYSEYENLQSQSLASQVESQFSPDFEHNKRKKLDACNGIFFIGFDNTLFNTNFFQSELRMYAQMSENVRRHQLTCTQQAQEGLDAHPDQKKAFDANPFKLRIEDRFYNGVRRPKWREILLELKRKNFLIVLCTKRPAVVGEDEGICKFRRDLADCIDREIFMGDLGSKGPLMEHIWCYILDHWKIEFPKQNFYLLDDNKTLHLDPAEALGFSTIQTAATNQIEFVQVPISNDPLFNPLFHKYNFHTVTRLSNPSFIARLREVPIPTPPIRIQVEEELVPLGSIFHSIQESFLTSTTRQAPQLPSAAYSPPSPLSSEESFTSSSSSSSSAHQGLLAQGGGRRKHQNGALLMDLLESAEYESAISSQIKQSTAMNPPPALAQAPAYAAGKTPPVVPSAPAAVAHSTVSTASISASAFARSTVSAASAAAARMFGAFRRVNHADQPEQPTFTSKRIVKLSESFEEIG